jgi:hypothetical protein
MTKIIINWPRGTLKRKQWPSDQMADVYASIADEINLNSGDFMLWKDEDYATRRKSTPSYAPVSRTGTFANARLKDGQVVFMEVLVPLPDLPAVTAVPEANLANAFLVKEEKPTQSMQSVQSAFGKRAVGMAHFEHRDLHKPHVTRQAESSCYAVRIAPAVLRVLVAKSTAGGFSNHQIAYLYGRKQVITGKVTVHWAFLPDQISRPDSVEVPNEIQFRAPNAIARLFGIELVGAAIAGQFPELLPFKPYMIKFAAKQQLANEHFVTILVGPKEGSREVEIVAYQVSDAAMKLVEGAYLVQTDNPDTLAFKEDLRFCQIRKHEVSGTDLNLLLIPIRVRKPSKPRIAARPTHFPPFSEGVAPLDVDKYLTDNEYCPNWHRLFDFDLLVYLVERGVLAIDNELPTLVDAIINKREVPRPIMTKIMKEAKRKR